jgi:hypothetical protein
MISPKPSVVPLKPENKQAADFPDEMPDTKNSIFRVSGILFQAHATIHQKPSSFMGINN